MPTPTSTAPIDQRTDQKPKSKKARGNKYIILNPTMQPIDILNMTEQVDRKTAVVTFGRFNPPTIGHQMLISKIVEIANKNNAVPMVFASHSEDDKTNPLSYNDKIKFLSTGFGKVIQRSTAVDIIAVLRLLSGYKNVTVVVGQDRVAEFDRLVNKYNGKQYNIGKLSVVSAGVRDPDGAGVVAASASQARKLAVEGNYQKFAEVIAPALHSHTREIYKLIRKKILSEQNELDEALTIGQRQKKRAHLRRRRTMIDLAKKRAMRRHATTPVFQKRAKKSALAAVKQKLAGGRSLRDLSPGEKSRVEDLAKRRKALIARLAQRMMKDVRKRERERFESRSVVKDVADGYGSARIRAFRTEEHGAGFEGTPQLTKRFKKETPGQKNSKTANEALVELATIDGQYNDSDVRNVVKSEMFDVPYAVITAIHQQGIQVGLAESVDNIDDFCDFFVNQWLIENR